MAGGVGLIPVMSDSPPTQLPHSGGLQFRAGLSCLHPAQSVWAGPPSLTSASALGVLKPMALFLPLPTFVQSQKPRGSSHPFPAVYFCTLGSFACATSLCLSHFLCEKITFFSLSRHYKLLEVGSPFLLILVAPSRSSTVFGTSC